MENSWQGYLNALGTQKPPRTTIDTGTPFPTTEGNTISTGFVEWTIPRAKREQQAKYDAMSGSWKGVKASESASASSIYKAEFMPLENSK
jgi:hypothetical protein